MVLIDLLAKIGKTECNISVDCSNVNIHTHTYAHTQTHTDTHIHTHVYTHCMQKETYIVRGMH